MRKQPGRFAADVAERMGSISIVQPSCTNLAQGRSWIDCSYDAKPARLGARIYETKPRSRSVSVLTSTAWYLKGPRTTATTPRLLASQTRRKSSVASQRLT